MMASFLVVPHDLKEVQDVAPDPHRIVSMIESRVDDGSFAVKLAEVLLQHLDFLTNTLQGNQHHWFVKLAAG